MKALALILICCGLVSAEVADSAPNGFTVKTVLEIAAPPAEVYRKLVGNVGDWWNPDHSFSGNSHNLTIDAKPMGCFCEKLPAGGGARHMEVVNATPGATLIMIGGLGPLQSLAAAGTMTVTLAPSGAGTKLAVTYSVLGYPASAMTTWASPVDSVVREQFTRLKSYVETGDPFGRKPEK